MSKLGSTPINPCVVKVSEQMKAIGEQDTHYKGLTKREYIATQMMQAWTGQGYSPEKCAKIAIEDTDALLKALEG